MTRERFSRLRPVVIENPKNVWLAVILTAVFGPFGLFYVTVPGAMLMLVVAIALTMFTFGLGLFLVWPFCVVWAWRATISHNKRIYIEEHQLHPVGSNLQDQQTPLPSASAPGERGGQEP